MYKALVLLLRLLLTLPFAAIKIYILSGFLRFLVTFYMEVSIMKWEMDYKSNSINVCNLFFHLRALNVSVLLG